MKILLRFDEGAAFCRPSTRQKRKLDVRGRQNAALRKEISIFVNISLIHAFVVSLKKNEVSKNGVNRPVRATA